MTGSTQKISAQSVRLFLSNLHFFLLNSLMHPHQVRKFAHFFGRQGQPGPIGRNFFDFLHGVPGTAWYQRPKNDSNCSQHLKMFRNRGAAAALSARLGIFFYYCTMCGSESLTFDRCTVFGSCQGQFFGLWSSSAWHYIIQSKANLSRLVQKNVTKDLLDKFPHLV